MKHTTIVILLIFNCGFLIAQEVETFTLKVTVSKSKVAIYKRVIAYDRQKSLFRVKDYFENGLIQMEAFYSAFDKHVKEEYQCNYKTNIKEGPYREWYENGQIKFVGTLKNGLRYGLCKSWYRNGQIEEESNWLNGQLHGNVKYWSQQGRLQFDLFFEHGLNKNSKSVSYKYLSYKPKDYDTDTLKMWPLIIYLHGGSDRGNDLNKLYSQGIPDQLYRGREFPFVIVAPQCPEHIRFSTENWFENFYNEINAKYRIDTNRVYLTGMSLGGSGTWYLATKYPGKFTAIAPMSGFTRHLDFINDNIDKLIDIPIWAFHGKIDNVVPYEETEWIIKKLEGKNKDLKFTFESEVGHWIHWLVYPNQELYDWFLKFDKRVKSKNYSCLWY